MPDALAQKTLKATSRNKQITPADILTGVFCCLTQLDRNRSRDIRTAKPKRSAGNKPKPLQKSKSPANITGKGSGYL